MEVHGQLNKAKARPKVRPKVSVLCGTNLTWLLLPSCIFPSHLKEVTYLTMRERRLLRQLTSNQLANAVHLTLLEPLRFSITSFF